MRGDGKEKVSIQVATLVPYKSTYRIRNKKVGIFEQGTPIHGGGCQIGIFLKVLPQAIDDQVCSIEFFLQNLQGLS